MLKNSLSSEDAKQARDRRAALRIAASDIAEIVGDVPTLTDTRGDIGVPKAPLVAGLALYFKAAGVRRAQFIERAYRHPAALP
jgi:hypothetical protein